MDTKAKKSAPALHDPRASLPYRTQRFYERVSSERERALDGLDDVFTEDIHFMNPVVDEIGMKNFRAQWLRAFRMYTVFHFSNFFVTGNDDRFIMSYEMRTKFIIGPVFTIKLTTECFGRDGKVATMRDEFDTMITLLQPFPLLTCAYKTMMRVLIA